MRKLTIMLAIAAITFTSCGQSKSAFKFSEELTAKENALLPLVTAEEAKASEFFSSGKYDSLAAVGKRMSAVMQQKADEVRAMKAPNVKEADNFKASVVKSYEVLKKVYDDYTKVGMAATEEERAEAIQGLQATVEEKKTAVSDMQAAQRKFADANGFKVQ